MAVTAVVTRTSHSDLTSSEMEFVSMALTGTYVTGGFTFNPYSIVGGLGSSPLNGRSIRFSQFQSPTGFIYVPSVAGSVMTVKIYSASGTELANGTAVPDAVVTGYILKSKV